MKPFEQQTYYEILDLPPSASDADIREAHARALEMYAPDSVALYAIEDPSRLEALRARITEAMEMLTDADLRAEYDQSLGLPPRARERVAALQAAAQGETQVPLHNLGAASRLFARLASPQPGFSMSYVAFAPLPLFAPTQRGPAEPAPAVEPVSAAPQRTPAPEPVPTAPEPAAVAHAPAPERPEASRAEASRAPGAQAAAPASVEPVAARAADEPPAAESPAQEASTLALSVAAARAREARPEPRGEDPRPRVPEIPPDAEFNGELLRRVREARGFTLRVLADRTKIGTRHLENVEADRYDALPTSVYLRGILMNLSRELGLDPLRVCKSYLALASKPRGR